MPDGFTFPMSIEHDEDNKQSGYWQDSNNIVTNLAYNEHNSRGEDVLESEQL